MIPTLLKFKDLKSRGIVGNWTTLLRWIKSGDFPPGFIIGRNTRVWTDVSVAEWLTAQQEKTPGVGSAKGRIGV